MQNITLNWLKDRRVCTPAVEAFIEKFGKGASVSIQDTISWLHEKRNPHTASWEAWLLGQDISLTIAMLECGADIHASADFAVCFAAGRGDLELVKFLDSRGIDIHTYKDFPFLFAAENGYLDVVKWLVGRGADIHSQKDYALHVAEKRDHNLVADFLRQTAQKS